MALDDLPKGDKSSGQLDFSNRLSQSVMLEMQLNAQRSRAEETVWTKLSRQADVVLGGTAQGTIEHGKKALTDPTTLAEFGGAAAIATGMTMAQGRGGLLRLGAQVLGLSMAGAYAKDVYGQGADTFRVMQDTWNSPENADRNRSHIKDTLGPFVVDFGIFSAGGAAGIGAGKLASAKLFGENPLSLSVKGNARPLYEPVRGSLAEIAPRNLAGSVSESSISGGMSSTPGIRGSRARALSQAPNTVLTKTEATPPVSPVNRGQVEIPVVEMGSPPQVKAFPADSPLARVYQSAKESVGKIEVIAVDRDGAIEARTANALYLGEGKMVTNFHVVERASDMYVMDAAGRAHRVHTVAHDALPDIAVVQLSDRASYRAFKPAKVNPESPPKPGTVAAVGHYGGHNDLHASPGTITRDLRQTDQQLRFSACIMEGNCGGPVYNMKGEVLGIVKQGDRDGIAVPSRHFSTVMKDGVLTEMPQPIVSPRPTLSVYEVDAAKARANVSRLFDTALEGHKPPEFFHSKVKRVNVEQPDGGAKELVLRTQISPGTREVVVEPIALDGRPLTKQMTWPGTDIPIASSSLTLSFGRGLQTATMQAVNDPHSILRHGFAYRSNSSYLAELSPKSSLLH